MEIEQCFLFSDRVSQGFVQTWRDGSEGRIDSAIWNHRGAADPEDRVYCSATSLPGRTIATDLHEKPIGDLACQSPSTRKRRLKIRLAVDIRHESSVTQNLNASILIADHHHSEVTGLPNASYADAPLCLLLRPSAKKQNPLI